MASQSAMPRFVDASTYESIIYRLRANLRGVLVWVLFIRVVEGSKFICVSTITCYIR